MHHHFLNNLTVNIMCAHASALSEQPHCQHHVHASPLSEQPCLQHHGQVTGLLLFFFFFFWPGFPEVSSSNSNTSRLLPAMVSTIYIYKSMNIPHIQHYRQLFHTLFLSPCSWSDYWLLLITWQIMFCLWFLQSICILLIGWMNKIKL